MDSLSRFDDWIPAFAVAAAATATGILLNWLFLRRLRSLAAKTETKVDDLILDSLGRHLPIWFGLAGAWAGVLASPLGDPSIDLVRRVIVALAIVSASFAVSRFASGLVQLLSAEVTASPAATSLTLNLVRLAVLSLGGLLLLANLGLSITPLLTALGVGSLALALALQDTLANLFGGIHLILSRKVEVGQFVQLETGQEGWVVDVGYRTTRLRDGRNNFVLVPNLRMSQGLIVNLSAPDPIVIVPVRLRVVSTSDLPFVEQATLDVAREVQANVDGAVRDHEPTVRFTVIGDVGIDLEVSLSAASVASRGLLTHELLKRVSARYRRDGIEIPAVASPMSSGR